VLDRNGIPARGQITRVLPAVTAFQTVPTAAKLALDVSKSTMVANAVPPQRTFPRGQKRTLRDNPGLTRAAPDSEAPDRSVGTSRTDGCLPGKRGLTAEMSRGVAPHGG